MKTKTLQVLIVSLLIGNLYCFGQKPVEKSKYEKYNLRLIETYKDNSKKRDKKSEIIRANYSESYFTNKHKQADSVALSYLRFKQKELGISENLDDVRIKKVRKTPGGKYVYFEQVYNGIPVFSTSSMVAINQGDTVTYMLNNFRQFEKSLKTKAKITNNEALEIASNYLNIETKINRKPKTELVLFESIDKGMELAWKVNVVAMKPMGDWQVIINANDSRIIHVEDLAMYHNGSGMIYNPNPITSAQTTYGGNFVDNSDANNTSLQNERIQVTLRDITLENGLYKLEGPYCVLDDIETPSDNFPELSNQNGFNYTRNQQEFEAVMVYYHIDLASRYVESLGYDEPDLRTFSADPHGLDGADNSHYMPTPNYVAYGEGGVDDAEDADIIWHEYGHALQWNLGTGYMPSVGETMSVKEGSSDYWAVSYSRSVSTYNWWLWANWDGHNTFWDGRRADLDWVYPDDYVSGHDGGQIWSAALMKIWTDLGRNITDRLFLETHFLWGSSPSMEDAAEAFIQADIQLYNGSHLCTIIDHFRTHGLTDRTASVTVSNRTITSDETVIGCDVNVTNTTVENNSKLIINAGNNVVIEGEFEVKLGSELEIK